MVHFHLPRQLNNPPEDPELELNTENMGKLMLSEDEVGALVTPDSTVQRAIVHTLHSMYVCAYVRTYVNP